MILNTIICKDEILNHEPDRKKTKYRPNATIKCTLYEMSDRIGLQITASSSFFATKQQPRSIKSESYNRYNKNSMSIYEIQQKFLQKCRAEFSIHG